MREIEAPDLEKLQKKFSDNVMREITRIRRRAKSAADAQRNEREAVQA